MKKVLILTILLIILSFAVGIYLYPQMPEKVASHWNAQGQVNGYMSKFWGIFLMPFISIALLLLLLIIPKMDPLKENIKKFKDIYYSFIFVIILFLFYLYLLTLAWNLGITFNFVLFLVPAFSALFFYTGILIENAKRNWFIGIRTPWTISNENVWKKTHKLGGKLFKISAIIGLIGMLIPKYALVFILIPVFFTSIYTILYSYFEYKKEVQLNKKPRK